MKQTQGGSHTQVLNSSVTVNTTNHNNTNIAGVLTLTPSSSFSLSADADETIWWVIVAPVLFVFGIVLLCRFMYSFYQCICSILNWCDWFMKLHMETNEGKKILTERRINVKGKSFIEIVRPTIKEKYFFYWFFLLFFLVVFFGCFFL